jgi:hypothetical protein
VGKQFLNEFYLILKKKTKVMDREFVKHCTTPYRIFLLKQYMKYLQGIYKNAGMYQSIMLEGFKDAPGVYFDIDQKKINITLKAPPIKSKPHKDSTDTEEYDRGVKKAEMGSPVILLNSKKLTNLQMERFPHNDFLEFYETDKGDTDIKLLAEIEKLILAEVIVI